MKKLLFLVLCLSALGSNFVFAGNPLNMTVTIIDDTPQNPSKEKAPMRVPRIYQDGYTLSFSNAHPDYVINIIQDDEVVFTSYIPSELSSFELPGTIHGECTIQLIMGRYCFSGNVLL